MASERALYAGNTPRLNVTEKKVPVVARQRVRLRPSPAASFIMWTEKNSQNVPDIVQSSCLITCLGHNLARVSSHLEWYDLPSTCHCNPDWREYSADLKTSDCKVCVYSSCPLCVRGGTQPWHVEDAVCCFKRFFGMMIHNVYVNTISESDLISDVSDVFTAYQQRLVTLDALSKSCTLQLCRH